MFTKRFLALVHNLARIRISNDFSVPIIFSVNDPFELHPLAQLPKQVIAFDCLKKWLSPPAEI
jgi:hypothetical protein